MIRTRLYHINVTRRCTLGCAHCYIDARIRKGGKILPPEDFSRIMAGARRLHELDSRPPEIHVIGGEPALVPMAWHQAYLDVARSRLDGTPFTLSLVSALPNRRAAAIACLYPRVITSWDAGARSHSSALWLEQVNRVRGNGVEVHVAVTLSRTVLAFGIGQALDFLHDQAGFAHVHLAPLIPTASAKSEAPLNGEVSLALIESAHWAMTHPDARVTPYAGFVAAGLGGYDELACPVRQDAINIEPDMRLCSCVAKAGATRDLPTCGEDVASAMQSPDIRAEKARHLRLPSHCLICRHRVTCQGGCRIAFEHQPFDASGECHGFSRFLDFVALQSSEDGR